MRDAKGLIELTMMVETNGALAPVREYFHLGQMYVEGIDGARYALRIKNLSGARIEVIASVDGLDVGSGEDGSFSLRGMILTSQRTYDFEGYRLDLNAVATFRFGGVGGSYAAQMGKPRNIGVIGVAMFEEKVAPPPPPPAPMPMAGSFGGPQGGFGPPPMGAPGGFGPPPGYGPPMPGSPPSFSPPPSAFGGPPPPPMAAPAPAATRAAPAPQSLGTAFGERREAKVGSTTFDRATSSPASMLSLRYEHREALRALGVPIDDLATRETANPFPAEPGPFAKPPPGWRG